MPKTTTLVVVVGHSSLTGPRPRNEDFLGFVTPEGVLLETKGILLAVADERQQVAEKYAKQGGEWPLQTSFLRSRDRRRTQSRSRRRCPSPPRP